MTRCALALLLVACNGGTPTDTGGGDTDTGATDAVCTEPTAVPCEDEIILDLALGEKTSSASITNTAAGAGWVTGVDATAGGFGGSGPWVYAKFTANGLERVAVEDVASLTSMDWDIAFKRYNIRLNGGVSGPSCVGAIPLLEADYDAVTEVPDGGVFRYEAFYTEVCEFVPDSFGLGGPQVLMSNWWSYETCVKTTGAVYVVELADGRHLKLTVDQYYAAGQDECNANGTTGEDAANLKFRWSFL